MFSCTNRNVDGINKLPCNYNPLQKEQGIHYQQVNVKKYHAMLYNLHINVPSKLCCVMLCLMQDSFAVKYQEATGRCFCLSARRRLCGEKKLHKGNQLMVRQVREASIRYSRTDE
jgi:hypothetical protein